MHRGARTRTRRRAPRGGRNALLGETVNSAAGGDGHGRATLGGRCKRVALTSGLRDGGFAALAGLVLADEVDVRRGAADFPRGLGNAAIERALATLGGEIEIGSFHVTDVGLDVARRCFGKSGRCLERTGSDQSRS